MASGILRVTPETLQATASSFEGTAGTVQGYTQQMTEIVNGLSGQVFSGEDAVAYVNKFNGLQDDMDRIYKMIKEHSEDLISFAQEYTATTNTNQDLINSLSSDVIV